LFYLRSRGLPEREARRLLIEGFFEEVVSKIPEIYRDDVANRIAEAL
jgi:Fe-S cluster assembly scaffold protein SufB